jgi:hypothetical protein
MAINWTVLTGAKTVAGSIANWVNRGDLPTENILLEAEAAIYERLRVREMMEVATLSFLAAASTATLPADFLDPIEFRPYGRNGELPYIHEQKIGIFRDESGNLEEGEPSRWSIIGTTAHVDVACESAYSGKLMYYKRPAALSVSNLTNFLTIRYPTLLRMACMSKAFEHMKLWGQAQTYLALMEAEVAKASATNESFRRSQHVPY